MCSSSSLLRMKCCGSHSTVPWLLTSPSFKCVDLRFYVKHNLAVTNCLLLTTGLLTFSSASPLLAILTFLLLGRIISLSDERNVALCVLFSGGTVLHAGMVHVLPPVLDSIISSGRTPHADTRLRNVGSHHHYHHLRVVRHKNTSNGFCILAVLLSCSLIPLIISAVIPEA
jgi:hypothetical protein